MIRLCRKDIIAGWWIWLVILVASVLYGTFPLQTNLAFMLAGLGFVLGCLGATLILEDRYKTEVYFCSLPLRRSAVVQARYLLAGILAAAGLILVLPCGLLANLVLKQISDQRVDLNSLLSVEGITGFLFTAALLISFYLPFYYGKGLGRGTMQFTVAVSISALVLFGLERAAQLLFHYRRPVLTPEFLKDPGLAVVRMVGDVKEALSPPVFVALSFGLAAAVVVLSVRLSVRFYDQREF